MQTSGNVSDPSRLIIPDVLTHCEHYRCEPTTNSQVGFGRLSLHDDQVHPYFTGERCISPVGVPVQAWLRAEGSGVAPPRRSGWSCASYSSSRRS